LSAQTLDTLPDIFGAGDYKPGDRVRFLRDIGDEISAGMVAVVKDVTTRDPFDGKPVSYPLTVTVQTGPTTILEGFPTYAAEVERDK
jgi:hypothetical protein